MAGEVEPERRAFTPVLFDPHAPPRRADERVEGREVRAAALTRRRRRRRSIARPRARAPGTGGLVLAEGQFDPIGGLWEICECSAGKILSTQVSGSVDDPATDLIMDTIGSVLAALLSLWVLPIWTDAHDDEDKG